ncbi:hypothetical protein D3C72_2526230 [compost metagenome]
MGALLLVALAAHILCQLFGISLQLVCPWDRQSSAAAKAFECFQANRQHVGELEAIPRVTNAA